MVHLLQKWMDCWTSAGRMDSPLGYGASQTVLPWEIPKQTKALDWAIVNTHRREVTMEKLVFHLAVWKENESGSSMELQKKKSTEQARVPWRAILMGLPMENTLEK